MPSRNMAGLDERAHTIATALWGCGVNARADRRGRAIVEVFDPGSADPMPYEMIAYFDLEPFEALDNRGIAEEILRQLAIYLHI